MKILSLMTQLQLHLLREQHSLLLVLVLKEQHWTLVGKAVYLIDINTRDILSMAQLLVNFFLMILYLKNFWNLHHHLNH